MLASFASAVSEINLRDELFFTELRSKEYSRLDAEKHVYLDYTGSGLYAERQVRAHAALLSRSVLGNPHSENPASRRSTRMIDEARAQVLRFLDAPPEEYAVIFTANASAAIKLVAESFPFGPDASLILTADNHNSMNGIREFARKAGGATHYLPLDGELRLDRPDRYLAGLPRESRGLFGFPAQSNFSGVKHPLSLVRRARSLGYTVLLDAAAFLPTSPLSLCEVPADFVALSFYKVFGFPTGVGALVARRAALARLERPWFAGGTLKYAGVHSVFDMISIIAASNLFIGTSLHGNITAFSYGIPHLFGPLPVDKAEGFLKITGLPAELKLDSWSEISDKINMISKLPPAFFSQRARSAKAEAYRAVNNLLNALRQ